MAEDRIMKLYNRLPLRVAQGNGVWLTDVEGQTYLDCVSGIATNALGHAHPKLVEALSEQARKLWHVSNIFEIPGQEELAKRLTGSCFADVVFFTNSGTEAVEAALKAARRYHAVGGMPERIDIIGFEGSFHGRTYAAINASGNDASLDGFGPRLPGYVHLSLNDEDAIARAVTAPTTAAVIVEPVQGEGGARALPGEWLHKIRCLTSAHGVLLIYDEVQCGMGRTGKLFAHQWFEDVEPDIMTVAKALGGGFPVGACLASDKAARGMTLGVHGSTFGGNPLAMAVALATFDEIATTKTLSHVIEIADEFRAKLEEMRSIFPDIIVETRGKGLLLALKLATNNREFMDVARQYGLLIAGGGDNCVRFLPSLLMTSGEVSEAVNRFEKACLAVRTKLTMTG